MDDLDIFSNEADEKKLTINKIIEKFIPVIGAILLTTGILYLLYTNIWINLGLAVKLGLGFLLSFGIIGIGIKFTEKLKYLADVIIGIGTLLLYGTLIYGSRSTEMGSALIPEISTLIVSFIFTFFIAFFATARKSKVILMLGMIGAYITPFMIGQVGEWSQSISFNSYLIYFTTINVVIFQLGKELSIRDIIPLNILGLFLGTTTLYHLSYTNNISNSLTNGLLSGEIFSAILLFLLSIFSMWSIIITSKEFEEKDEGYIAIGYIGIIFWFIFNIGLLDNLSDIFQSILLILLSISSFYGWHFLKDTKTKFQHTSLYAGGILSLVFGLSHIIPELNTYSSIAIAYSSLIFGFLYTTDTTKVERLISYYFLSIIGGALAILFIHEANGGIESFKVFYVVLSLIPAMFAYYITKKSENEDYIEISKVYSITAVVLALIFILVKVIQYINFELVVYYILPLLILVYIKVNEKLSLKNKTIILRFSISWLLLGYFHIFVKLFFDVYPAPTDTYFFTHEGFFSDIKAIFGVLASTILFLGLSISRKLKKEDVGNHPTYLLVILSYTSLFVIINYVVCALINDFSISTEHGGIRAVTLTLWWTALSLFLLIIGLRKGSEYYAEKELGLFLLFLTVVKIGFYDLATMGMEKKIIVLIIVGGILMMFSYFIQSKGWLKKDNETKSDFNTLISKTNTHGISKVTFKINDNEDLSTKSKNIIKIVYYVAEKYGKKNFEAGELKKTFDYIITNYKSELDTKTVKMISGKLKLFVDNGGKIDFDFND